MVNASFPMLLHPPLPQGRRRRQGTGRPSPYRAGVGSGHPFVPRPLLSKPILSTIWPQGLAIGDAIEGRTIRRNMLKAVFVFALAAAAPAAPSARADFSWAGA